MKSFLLTKVYWLGLVLLVGAGLLAGAESHGQQSSIVVTGTLEVLITEPTDQGTAVTDYFFKADGGPTYQLQFALGPQELLNTGQRVTVEGTAEGNTLQVQTLTPDYNPPAPTTGNHSVVVLMVDLLDAKASGRYTLQQITDNMYTGARSVQDLYNQASLGQFHFVADSNNDGAPDVFGPYTINYYAADGCDYSSWALAAESAAQQAGIDVSLYQHRVFVLPRYNDSHCSWSGIANLGCDISCRVWIAEGESPMIYAHELGHNLGLAHAGTDPENDGVINDTYGDYSDPMGNSRLWHLFSAPHVDQLGWYPPESNSIVTVTQSGNYSIAVLDASPLVIPPIAPRILKLQGPSNRGNYYLSYRQPTGYDDTLSTTYTRGVDIHWYKGDGGNTAFVKSLFDGAAFIDTTGGLIQVMQTGHNSNYATVNIVLCTSTPPQVTLDPPSRAVKPGDANSYTVFVTNQDSADCPSTTFTLNYVGSPGGSITPSSLTLNGGATGVAALQVNGTAGLASNTYSIKALVSDIDNVPPAHPTSTASGVLIIDGDPPTLPTGLSSAFDAQGKLTLNWNASTDSLTSVKDYIVQRNSQTLGRTTDLAFVDSSPPTGQNVYAVAATDSVGNVSPTTSATTTWPPAPTVAITKPTDGATLTSDQSTTFTGTATDPLEGDLTARLNWTSSLDGAIGSGGAFSRTLSAGTHTIQAQATNSGGTKSTMTEKVIVIKSTTTTLTSIGAEDGWVLESSETSNIGGSIKASDSTSIGLMVGDSSKKYQYKSILSFDTSSLPYNATMNSATLRLQRGALSGASPFTTHGALLADVVTGAFNSNAALETADFQAPATATGVATLSNAASTGAWSEGKLNNPGLAAINKTGRTQFRLYFSLDDNNNSTADYLGYYAGEYATAASRPQLVVTYVVNAAPKVTISAPADNVQYAPGTTIVFSGSASDTEEGDLSANLVWTSDRDGLIGRGNFFISNMLSTGIHTITASVTDGLGARGVATITLINSNNQAPVVTIGAFTNNARFAVGQTINFTGVASDAEDSNLSAGLQWTSSIDGNIGTGGAFSRTLSVGTHTIQAKVTDSGGFPGKATVTVTVVNPTTVTLNSIGAEDGWVLESTETSNVGGSLQASDSTTKGLLVGDSSGNQQYRSFLSFDTSSIPAGSSILTAKLRLQRGTLSGTNPFTTHGNLNVDMVTGAFNGIAALEAADFQAAATVTGVAILSNAASNGAWSEGTINNTSLVAINRTGRTQFRLYFSLDDNNTSTADYVGFYAGEYRTTTSRPQLVVTFY